ncbi:hypothetical protein D3C79_570790 [compost metagenome]
MGILAADAQAGALGHGVECRGDLGAAGDWQLGGGVVGEAVLGVDIEAGDFHGVAPALGVDT